MDTKRFKNYGLWVAVLALIAMIPEALSTYGIIVTLPINYGPLGNALLGLAVLAGILNNPTTENKGFLDDKEDKAA